MTTSKSEQTDIDVPQSHQVGIVVVCAVLGLLLGMVLPYLAGWALSLPWTPLQGPLRLIDQISDGWVRWALPVLGLVVGLVGGLTVAGNLVKVRITPGDLTVIKGDSRRRFSRAQVTLVEIDAGHLVLRGRDDEDLIREKLDVDTGAVLEAARRHAWPLTRSNG